jgi:hypothetical protein
MKRVKRLNTEVGLILIKGGTKRSRNLSRSLGSREVEEVQGFKELKEVN